jgi:nitrite reductase/ring-hydroxylating ferredoxin subunit
MYFSAQRNQRIAARLFKHIEDTTTDRLDALLDYDLSIYTSPEIAQQERQRIFQRLPMMAAHVTQVPEPGSFITLALNASQVLITRQADGSVGAFLNVCRHRGTPLTGEASGQRGRFTCPYHGWTYGNDGRLLGIGFADSFGARPGEGDRNLVALPVQERHGFIWIVEDPAGSIDVRSHLGDEMDQALGEYGLGNWFHYKTHVFDFPQNWKVMMDGLLDGYHVQFLHGKTISPYFYPNMMGIEILGRNALWGTPRRSMEKVLHEQPGETPLDKVAILGNLMNPNAVMVMHPHHIEFWTVYQNPRDPGACRVHLRYLTPQGEHDERSVQRLEKNWKIAVDAILNEDVPVGNGIQASAAMPNVGRVCLGRNEVTNQLFHLAWRDYMGFT